MSLFSCVEVNIGTLEQFTSGVTSLARESVCLLAERHPSRHGKA